MDFKLTSAYIPTGDQPKAIEQLVRGVRAGEAHQTLLGVTGSGKTFISTAHALQELQKGKYQRIVLIRNDVTVQNIKDVGSLPGSLIEKLRESVAYMGDIISDYMFDTLLQQNKITVAYLGTLRSRSISDSYVLNNESQNQDVEIMKMIVSRIGDNSRLVVDYDINQLDRKVFEKSNGVVAMSECLKGESLFGAVELQEVERSAVARLAQLIHL